MRVSWNAVGRAHAHKAGRKLVEIGFADDEGACGFEARYDGCIALGVVGKGRTAGRGRQTFDIDVVLDCNGNAIEWAIGVALGRKALCVRDDLRLIAKRNEYRVIAVRADALKAARDDFGRRYISCPKRLEDCGDSLGQIELQR